LAAVISVNFLELNLRPARADEEDQELVGKETGPHINGDKLNQQKVVCANQHNLIWFEEIIDRTMRRLT
jgi:hypothetical protein